LNSSIFLSVISVFLTIKEPSLLTHSPFIQ
jgi:hypothetical protein